MPESGVTLVSSDNISIQVARGAITRSALIEDALHDIQGQGPIPVDVKSKALYRVVEWCQHEHSVVLPPEAKVTKFDDLDEWERQFFLYNREIVSQIIEVSNYLEIERLFYSACMYAAALETIQVLPEFPQEIWDTIRAHSPREHFTRTTTPNVESQTTDLCTRYSYHPVTAGLASIWACIEISEFHHAHLARENHHFLLDVFNEGQIASITTVTIRLDPKILQVPGLAQKILDHEIKNLTRRASKLMSLEIVGVPYSSSLRDLFRYLLNDFFYERGRRLDCQFCEPSWKDGQLNEVRSLQKYSIPGQSIESKMAARLCDI